MLVTHVTTVIALIVSAGALRDEGRMARESHVWRAVKPTSAPEGFANGVPFYRQMNYKDRLENGVFVSWGRSLEGKDLGDWVGFQPAYQGGAPIYLPKKTLDGEEVLRPLDGEQWLSMRDFQMGGEQFRKSDVVEVIQKRAKEGHTEICVHKINMRPLSKIAPQTECAWFPLVLDKRHEVRHILFKRIDILPETLLDGPARIGVVGCGIAGIVASLELALNPDVHIIVIDRENGCAKGTSGRIAAEMMFYNFERDLFNKGENTFYMNWRKFWHSHLSLNLVLGGMKMLYNLNSERKDATGQQIEVEMTGRCAGIVFGSSVVGLPIVKNAGNCNKVQENDVLAKIDGIFTDELWKGAYNKSDDLVDQHIKNLIVNLRTKKLFFHRNADVRVLDAYQALFFQAAADRLQHLIRNYPKLCEAVITPFCCSLHAPFVNQNNWGYDCNGYEGIEGFDAGMGMASVFMTQETARNARSRGWDNAGTGFSLWNESTTKKMLPSYVGSEQHVYGAAVNRQRSGYVRTEDLGRVFEEIMKERGHAIWSNTELTGTVVTEGFQVIGMFKTRNHSWSVDSTTGIKSLRYQPDPYPDRDTHDAPFHGLMFCTGAAPEMVKRIDSAMGKQLVPAMGNIIVGPPNVVSDTDSRIGVVLEEFHMYLRSTKDRRLAVGGGMWFPPAKMASGAVRALNYKQVVHTAGELWGFTGDNYMQQAAIGRWLVDRRPRVLRQGGARPLCHFGNFPLIKLHPFAPIVINTGMGVNGFIMSWKSGQIAAELLLTRQVDLGGSVGTPWKAAWSWIGKATSAPHREPPSFFRVVAEELPVYHSMSIDGRPLSTLSQGKVVLGQDTHRGWVEIADNVGSGWIEFSESTLKFAVYKVAHATYIFDSDTASVHVATATEGQVYSGVESGVQGYGGHITTKGEWLEIDSHEGQMGKKNPKQYIKMKNQDNWITMEPCKGLECSSAFEE